MRVEPIAKQQIPVPFLLLNELFEHYGRHSPDAAAILAPNRPTLSYGALHHHIRDVGGALRAFGVGHNDRVAVMLPNGPELATAIFSVASNAACALVNPAYAAEELERYFAALGLRAVMLPAAIDSPARRAALARGLRIIEVTTAPDAPAGLFALSTIGAASPSPDPVGPGSVALLVLTSGTIARPKIVPLTHANVCTSAYSSVASVALTDKDRCLNVLPLFHCHGLNATVLAALAAGAGVVCAPGCEVNKFFDWLREFQVRWYSAVPAMHQAILAQARRSPAVIEQCRLRLIRSASAPLPPRVFAELEQTLGTIVIELYGMTETAGSPIACNPLPPALRKPGSCGRPVALDVAIMSDGGSFLPHGQTGQVAIRGAAIADGYFRDLALTRDVFVGGWLKTGDIGFFDEDGYLFLVGRSREIINRGGEKVTPREVDEVLLDHPSVAEAVTFAVRHATLGEDVAAAIVLRPRARATPKQIRQFAKERLADFKVPRQVFVLKELPKGPTGKVQRVGLAAKLGLADGHLTQAFVAPRNPLENVLARIWADVLELEQVGIHDDFFVLGGDSLLATHALNCIYDQMQLNVGVTSLFDAPTVVEMAKHLETLIQAGRARPRSLDIARVPREGGVPTSVAQQRLCKLHEVLPDLPFFNILYALRLMSPIDAALLERSLNEVVQRHEILRTTFAVAAGQHIQVIAPRLTIRLQVADVRKLSRLKGENATHSLVKEDLLHAFDLTHGPLIRARLVRLTKDQHLLLITMHQTIVDGWSLGVLIDELAVVYDALGAARPPPLRSLPIQYADFASWQRQWRSHPEIAAQLDYWCERLCDSVPAISLRVSRSKRAADALDIAFREIMLSASLTQALKEFSHREAGTLFMALLAGLQTLIHRTTGEVDPRVATNVANRNRPGTEGLIGPLVNTLILRTDLGGDPNPREIMRRVRATTLAAYAHQDLPFEELAATLAQEHGLDPAELSRVMILLQNAALRPVARSSKAFTFEEANPGIPMPLVTTTTYDVILVLRENVGGLIGSCIYKPHLFSGASIGRLLRGFQNVLEFMTAHPDRPISAMRLSLNGKSLKS